jgi:hypothetical protein
MRLVVEFERSDADNGVKQKGSVEDVVASCLLLVHSFFLVDALVDTVLYHFYRTVPGSLDRRVCVSASECEDFGVSCRQVDVIYIFKSEDYYMWKSDTTTQIDVLYP